MEQQQRQIIVKALTKSGFDATSVENPAYPGTPDIQYIGGWIECKYLEDWPKREETTVRIDHFTPQQRVWLLRRHVAWDKLNEKEPLVRCRQGGYSWLVLYVARTKDWLIFDGKIAALRVAKNGVNKIELFKIARLTTKNVQDVINYVTSD